MSIRYLISEYWFFVSSWCLSSRKSVWFDIDFFWSSEVDGEQRFQISILLQWILLFKKRSYHSFRYFTERNIFVCGTRASLHQNWSSAIWFTTKTLNNPCSHFWFLKKRIQGLVHLPKFVKKLKSVARLLEVMKKLHSTFLLDLNLLTNIPVIREVFDWLNQR